jgi:hypothetical protein
MTNSKIQSILKMRKFGFNFAAISRETGEDEAIVREVCRQHNAVPPKRIAYRRRGRPETATSAIRRLRREGYPEHVIQANFYDLKEYAPA